MNEYPNDADGVVLKQLSESGLDMSASTEFEFFIDSPDEGSSSKIENDLRRNGFQTEIDFDEGELEPCEKQTEANKEYWPSWTVYVYLNMVPDYGEIIRIQKQLDAISNPYGGKSDGWQVGIE